MYSVQIKATGRYVKYCDDNWYETSSTPWNNFTKEEAEKIAHQMRKHYVYVVTVSDGTESYEISAFKPKMAEPLNSAVGKGGIKKIKLKIKI